jgi:hypothetical protein
LFCAEAILLAQVFYADDGFHLIRIGDWKFEISDSYRHQEKEFHHEEHKGHEEKAKREVASLENQRLRAQVV